MTPTGLAEPNRLAIRWACCLGVGLLVLLAIGKSSIDIRLGPMADMRVRTVGARLLEAALDPYYTTSTEATPERLRFLGHGIDAPVTPVSVTPFTLILSQTTLALPYRYQRHAWFIVQWLALLGLVSALAYAFPRDGPRLTVFLALLVLFGCSYSWFLHVERGQIYVIYAMLLAVGFFLVHGHFRRADFLAGVVIGVAIVMRPPIALLPMLFLLFGYGRAVAGVIVGGLAVGLGITLFHGVDIWFSYLSSMPVLGKINAGLVSTGLPLTQLPIVEGVPQTSDRIEFGYAVTSIYSVLTWNGIGVPYRAVPFAFIVGFFSICGWWKHRVLKGMSRRPTLPEVFVAACALVFVCEFFLPPNRWPYCNVLFAVPLAGWLWLGAPEMSRRIDGRVAVYLTFGMALFGEVAFRWVDNLSLWSDFAKMGAACLIIYGILTSTGSKQFKPELN